MYLFSQKWLRKLVLSLLRGFLRYDSYKCRTIKSYRHFLHLKLRSRGTFISIVKESKRLHEGVRGDPRNFGIQNGRAARTAGLIRKVAAACSKRNTPEQRYLVSRHGVSVDTINRILAEDLAWNMRKKRKTHRLTDKQAAQRLEWGPGFLDYLGKYKSRMILAIDDTFVSLSDFIKERDIYCQGRELVVPPTWKKKSMKAWPRKIMVAMGICWEGFRLYIVPGKSKVPILPGTFYVQWW